MPHSDECQALLGSAANRISYGIANVHYGRAKTDHLPHFCPEGGSAYCSGGLISGLDGA